MGRRRLKFWDERPERPDIPWWYRIPLFVGRLLLPGYVAATIWWFWFR